MTRACDLLGSPALFGRLAAHGLRSSANDSIVADVLRPGMTSLALSLSELTVRARTRPWLLVMDHPAIIGVDQPQNPPGVTAKPSGHVGQPFWQIGAWPASLGAQQVKSSGPLQEVAEKQHTAA